MAAVPVPEFVLPALTLNVAIEWIEWHCVVPDGDSKDSAFVLARFQLAFVANHYEVKKTAKLGMLSSAFRYRRSQLMDAQKKGKSPLLAAMICLEGVGPAVFNGFAEGGEAYDCREFNCGCGFYYEYEPGEAMGRPWASPLIQLTANSLEQTDNTYDSLRPMILNGPLAEVITNVGEERIKLPGGPECRIEPVTSNSRSRLGQRVTFIPWDETGLYTRQNGMWKTFNTQSRGVAAMGGRGVETTNPYDPAEETIAKRTYESPERDLYKQHMKPPDDLDFKKKADRRQILLYNYQDAPWALRNIDGILGECNELMASDPAEAERFYGNRIVAGSGSWMSETEWMSKALGHWEGSVFVPKFSVQPRTKICLGMDLSNNNDWTGIRAETSDYYQFTPTYGDDKRLAVWQPLDFGGRIPRNEVRAAIDYLSSEFIIVRAYIDPAGSAKGVSAEDDGVEDDSWRLEMGEWAKTYGPKVFIPWETSRTSPMHASLETFRASVRSPESEFRHDGEVVTRTHIRNAVVRNRTGQRYILGKPNDHQKIDLAQSAVLAHEATIDALSSGDFDSDAESIAWL